MTGVSFNIGGKSEVYCYVQELSLPGTNISAIVNRINNSADIETIVEPISEVAVYDDRPVIYLASFYRTKNRLLGDFKLAHIMLDDHSINCTHDEPGFRKTFRNTIAYIAGNLEETIKSHKIIDKKVYTVNLGQVKAGFVIDLEARNGNENFRVSYQSLAIPISKNAIKTYDTQMINYLDKNREIVRNVSLAYENEKPEYQIGYDRIGVKKYQIQGVHDDKPVNRVVNADDTLVIEEDRIKSKILAKQKKFDLLIYQPSPHQRVL